MIGSLENRLFPRDFFHRNFPDDRRLPLPPRRAAIFLSRGDFRNLEVAEKISNRRTLFRARGKLRNLGTTAFRKNAVDQKLRDSLYRQNAAGNRNLVAGKFGFE